jgi:hypothetical protein
LTAILVVLTVCKISGSSIGVYHNIFYGSGTTDKSLVFNKPRTIRSDEWTINTLLTIAQKQNHYNRFNPNIGNNEDMSIVLDVPYKGWSTAFKPHNLVFFALPLEYAFALKWWLLSYLLVLSCYFFVLALMPGRRLFATCFATGLLFGGMFQWWYQYGTLASVYYSLFLATAVINLLRAKKRLHRILWGAAIAYLATCFCTYPISAIPDSLRRCHRIFCLRICPAKPTCP